MIQPAIQSIKDSYPQPAEFGLHPMLLEDYLDNSEHVLGVMMRVAEFMTERAVHYDRDKSNGSPVFVGACGAIALLGVMNEQTGNKEDLVVFSLGANIKAREEDEKYCAEWHLTDDADVLIEKHGQRNVEILDICVASPTPKPRIQKILNTERATLCPCHRCMVKLAMHDAITTSTGVHMLRMDAGNSEKDSTDVGALLQDLSIVARPRASDRESIRSRERSMRRHHAKSVGRGRRREKIAVPAQR